MFFISFAAVNVDPDVLRRHASLVREALRMADLSIEKASLYMGISKSQLCNQLSGEGHLSHTRLMLLPVDFWKWYAVLSAESFGLPTHILHARSLELAMRSRRKQLRMTVEPDSAKRRLA